MDMAKCVYNVRVEADEYDSLEDLLYKAGYENELLEEYEGDGQDDIVRGTKAMTIYLVKQTQPSADYHQMTIYVCSDEEGATNKARELNREYGEGCKFSEDFDFEEIDYDNYCYDDVHYYEVEAMQLDKPMA